MTDKRKLELLLTKFGMAFDSDQKSVTCSGKQDNVDGKALWDNFGFYSVFEFDGKGKFIKCGRWAIWRVETK
ncbi:MAG: hypothetical protein ACYC36_03640 [Bellilinea sp.]